MIKSKTISYHNWSDIREEICKEMNIDESHFRDYHKLIGGDYKDLWHEWHEYFEDISVVVNGNTVSNDLGETLESKLSWIRQDGKDWLEPFLNAVYKVWEDNNIENVKYSW